MGNAVNHPQVGLTALRGAGGAVHVPRWIERRVDTFHQSQSGQSAGTQRDRRISSGPYAHAGLGETFSDVLRVAHQLVELTLLGGVGAAHGDRARNVRGIAAILGGGINDDKISRLRGIAGLHVMQRGAVDARADNRPVSGTFSAAPRELVLERGTQLVFMPWVRREHRGAMAFRADLGGLTNERELGVGLFRAHLQHEWHAVAHGEVGETPGESLQRFLPSRERVIAREIHRFHVGDVVKWKAGGGERIEKRRQGCGRAPGDAVRREAGGRVHPLAVIEGSSRVERR